MSENILVLGVSGNVSQGILKAIRESNLNVNIIGACVNEDTVGALWCDRFYRCPYANSDDFIPWLIEICSKQHIDLVLTGVEENLYSIAKNIEILKQGIDAKIIVSDYDKLIIGQNKLLTCQWLKEKGFNYPLYAVSNDAKAVDYIVSKVGFPLIAKPIIGKGSHGLFVINDIGDLKKACLLDNYVIQECVGNIDSEYTVGCYRDKHGNSTEPIVMQRWLYNGATWKAKVTDNKVIKAECFKICEKFKPIGPMNIQLRLNSKGDPVPFEFNVRFSGTTPIRSHFGFCDVKAAISEYIYDTPINDMFNIKSGTAYRYINEVYNFSEINGLVIDKTLEA